MRSFEPATIVTIVMRNLYEDLREAAVPPSERTIRGADRSFWMRGRDRRSAGMARHRPIAGWER